MVVDPAQTPLLDGEIGSWEILQIKGMKAPSLGGEIRLTYEFRVPVHPIINGKSLRSSSTRLTKFGDTNAA